MKAKIIKTFDLGYKKEYFGIAFQVKKGSKYCKYPIELQSIETIEDAKLKLGEVQNKLDSLKQDQIDFLNQYPINKHQYVNL